MVTFVLLLRLLVNSPSVAGAENLNLLRHDEQQYTAAIGPYRMLVLGCGVEIVASVEMISAQSDVALEHEDLLTPRMVVGRIDRSRLEAQQDRRCSTGRLVEPQYFDGDAADSRLPKRLPFGRRGSHELIRLTHHGRVPPSEPMCPPAEPGRTGSAQI
jgi:hypothetical protein